MSTSTATKTATEYNRAIRVETSSSTTTTAKLATALALTAAMSGSAVPTDWRAESRQAGSTRSHPAVLQSALVPPKPMAVPRFGGSSGKRARGLEALAVVRDRTRVQDWDGEGAPKLGASVFRRAKKFLNGLPADLADPLVTPEDDGSLVLDWKADRDWAISVSVHASGSFGYSGLAGGIRQYGVLDANDDVPPGVVIRIRGILNKSA